jgi:hydrogenase maturation protease
VERYPETSAFSRSSTHSFGVAEAVELARALGRPPARVVVFGIEGRDFTPGEGLSPDVGAAVDEVVRRVAEERSGRTLNDTTVALAYLLVVLLSATTGR